MLSRRILIGLVVDGGRLVEAGPRGGPDPSDALAAARAADAAGADELWVLDRGSRGSAPQGRDALRALVGAIADEVSLPIAVVGGAAGVEDIGRLSEAGADRVVLDAATIERPELVRAAADRFGTPAIGVAIDARRGPSGDWEVHTPGGRGATGRDAVAWAREVAAAGAGEILLAAEDGGAAAGGFDLALTRALTTTVSIPVVTSLGAGPLELLYEVFVDGGADAALCTDLAGADGPAIARARHYLAGRGVPVRAIAGRAGPTAGATSATAATTVSLTASATVHADQLAGARPVSGLRPAIVQDARSGRVLMLGWMDPAAQRITVETGEVHLVLVAGGTPARAGGVTGGSLRLHSITADCDRDALLVRAYPTGPVCHTGSATCFGTDGHEPAANALDELSRTIGSRRALPPGSASYVRSLMDAGMGRMLGRLADETAELTVALKEGPRERVIGEAADAVFHLMVALAARDVTVEDVEAELDRRAGLSGLERKARRKRK